MPEAKDDTFKEHYAKLVLEIGESFDTGRLKLKVVEDLAEKIIKYFALKKAEGIVNEILTTVGNFMADFTKTFATLERKRQQAEKRSKIAASKGSASAGGRPPSKFAPSNQPALGGQPGANNELMSNLRSVLQSRKK